MFNTAFIMSFCLITEAATKSFLYKIRVLAILAKVLDKICEGVCFLVKLQTGGHIEAYTIQTFWKQIPSELCFKDFGKILVEQLFGGAVNRNCSK